MADNDEGIPPGDDLIPTEDAEDTQEVRPTPTQDGVREIKPLVLFGSDDTANLTDFRPIPVGSEEQDFTTGAAPKDSSVPESVSSSPVQDEPQKTEEISQPVVTVTSAPAVKVSGTPSPLAPSTPTSSPVQKAG